MPENFENYHSSAYPSRHRRKKNGGCSCDSNYAKSLQGICKVAAVFLAFLVCIIIGASPYHRAIFVLEGVTWPFHIVVLLTVLLLLATLGLYIFFLIGQHLEYPHIAWPTFELIFNIVAFFVTLLAVILEIANVWRWDYNRRYSQFNNGGVNSFNGNNGLLPFGNGGSLSYTGQLNMNSYCITYPNDCRDFVNLLTGSNPYYGSHIFACVALFALLILFLVSTFLAYRTWRVFKREMSNGVVNTEPSTWQKFQFRVSEIKMPSAVGNIRGKFDKLLKRNNDDDDVTADVELASVELKKGGEEDFFVDLKEKRFVDVSSRDSHHTSSKHGSSRHADDRSRASSASKHHRHRRDDEIRHHDHKPHHEHDEKHHRDSRSTRSARSSRSSKHRSRDASSRHQKEKDQSTPVADWKNSTPSDGPVASVVC